MKFVAYLICYLIYPFSFLFPRSGKKWAFGSFRRAFNDNAKYFFIYVCTQCPDIDAAWLSLSKDTVRQVRALGFKAYHTLSLKGMLHALRSGYWFFNSYTSDIMFCLSGDAVCFNLWHGVGLKRIEFNTVSGPLAERYVRRRPGEVFFHPESFRRPDYLLTSSPMQTSMFARAFRIPESRCLEYGYPRNAVLKLEEADALRFIERYEPRRTMELVRQMSGFRKVYIYMPTWRDSQREIFVQNMDLDRLDGALKTNGDLLLLKPHANTIIKKDLAHRSNILLLDSGTDVYPILPFTDVLVTDYSSILYDYLLMNGKSVILYLYDYEEYVKERDFYYPFDENVMGQRAENFGELLDLVKGGGPDILDENRRQELIERFWGKSPDPDASAALCKFVLSSSK